MSLAHRWPSVAGSLFLALAVAAASSGWVRPAPAAAQPARTWDVQVGGDLKTEGITVQAFLPDVLTVNVGDTVTWTFAAQMVPHSVSFNSGQPSLPDVVPGPGPGEFTLGPAFAPLGATNGSATYSGVEQINSGAPEGDEAPPPFRVTFTQPGVFTYVCPIHPGMQGTIDVIPAGAALPETAAQATARGQAQFAQHVAGLRAMLPRVQPGAVAVANGPTVRTVAAGVSAIGGASALQFLPGNVTVKRGDIVTWTVADPYEIHTVTFAGAEQIQFVDVRPQPSGPPLLVVPARVAGPVGGDTFTGQAYLNSGILGAGSGFAARIDAAPGTYNYLCLIHPDMKGTLTVTP